MWDFTGLTKLGYPALPSRVVETVAQLVEHGTFNAGVAGSSPAGLIKHPLAFFTRSRSSGRGFRTGDFVDSGRIADNGRNGETATIFRVLFDWATPIDYHWTK
jgi:hypothetical protein